MKAAPWRKFVEYSFPITSEEEIGIIGEHCPWSLELSFSHCENRTSGEIHETPYGHIVSL